MGQPSAGWARDAVRPVRFCTAPNGTRIAYAATGTGPPLLVPAAWISHLELLWQDRAYRDFFLPLAAARTVVQYDRPGCGLSAAWPGPQDLETDIEVIRTVADELGPGPVDLLGISLGAPASVAFAGRFPQRVDRLVLYGGFAVGGHIAAPAVRAAVVDVVRAHWGLGSEVLAGIFLPDGSSETKAHFARLQREAASVESAVETLAQCYAIDVSDELGLVTAPTLVLHRRGDRAIPHRAGQELAGGIRGARLVTLPGSSHFPYVGESAVVVRAILEFLDGVGAAPRYRPDGTSPPLTPRQLQVAALIADGMTNRQIAVRLGIEERSAEGHVERIRLRLGVTSRAQVAAWWAARVAAGEG